MTWGSDLEVESTVGRFADRRPASRIDLRHPGPRRAVPLSIGVTAKEYHDDSQGSSPVRVLQRRGPRANESRQTTSRACGRLERGVCSVAGRKDEEGRAAKQGGWKLRCFAIAPRRAPTVVNKAAKDHHEDASPKLLMDSPVERARSSQPAPLAPKDMLQAVNHPQHGPRNPPKEFGLRTTGRYRASAVVGVATRGDDEEEAQG